MNSHAMTDPAMANGCPILPTEAELRTMTDQRGAPDLGSPSRWWLFCGEVAAVVAVCLLIGGEPAPQTNEPHYLCRAKHLWDAEFCPGDFFLESPDAHVTFVYAVGWTTKWLSLPAVAWLGRVACWTLLAAAWCRLIRLVAPSTGFAAIGAAIWLVMIFNWNLAGEWIVGGFEAKCVAYGLVVFGLAAALEDRWSWAWGFLGFATAWHALVGAWSIVALAVVWLLAPGQRRQTVAMLPGLVAGALLGLIGVVPALWLSAGVPGDTASEAARVYVYERLPHHLALLSMKTSWLTERVSLNLKTICLFMATTVIVAVAWRYLGNRTARRLTQIMIFATTSLVIALLGFAIESSFGDESPTAASLLRFYWYRLADIAVPMAVAIATVCGLAQLAARRRNVAAVALVVVMLMIGQPLYQMVEKRRDNPAAPTDRHVANAADWRDACRWIRDNTPTDSLFVTPRGNTSFKWFAQRAEIITYKDVPQNAELLLEWRNRMSDVFRLNGNPRLPYCKSLRQLGTARILTLSRKYNFGYVLADARDDRIPLVLPIAHQNQTYIIYRIEQPQ